MNHQITEGQPQFFSSAQWQEHLAGYEFLQAQMEQLKAELLVLDGKIDEIQRRQDECTNSNANRCAKHEIEAMIDNLRNEFMLEKSRMDLNLKHSNHSLDLDVKDVKVLDVQQEHLSKAIVVKECSGGSLDKCDTSNEGVEAMEACCHEFLYNQQICATESIEYLRAEFRHENQKVRDELKSCIVEHRNMCLHRMESTVVELAQRFEESLMSTKKIISATAELAFRVDENDKKFAMFRQEQLSESVTLRERLEEAWGDRNQQASKFEGLLAMLKEEHSEHSSKNAMLSSRLENVEQHMSSISTVAVPQCQVEAASVAACERVSVAMSSAHMENNGTKSTISACDSSSTEQLAWIQQRLEALEQHRFSSSSAISSQACLKNALTVQLPEIDRPTISNSAIGELRMALAATNGHMARIAQEVATVRQEHDAAVTGIRGLTEFVARAATASIQRTEQRFAQEFTERRKQVDQEVSAHHEHVDSRMKAMLAEFVAKQM